MVPVLSFVGKSGAGKTTLLQKVVQELKQRGYRVAVIKHDVHHFDIDHPGKDSWRLTQAGADAVASSSAKLALIQNVNRELSLAELATFVAGRVDIILTEGYRTASDLKIEVARSERSTELVCKLHDLVAVVSDLRFSPDLPHFALEDIQGIVDFLLSQVALPPVVTSSEQADHLPGRDGASASPRSTATCAPARPLA